MTTTPTPVLLDGIRTPFGRVKGALSGLPGHQLNAIAMRELLVRQPELRSCDAVLLGQVLQAGQGQNPARLAATSAGVEWSVPAITLNSVCLAGLSSVADASRRIRTGEGEAYIVGGGDSMSQAPHASVIRDGVARPASVELVDTMVKDGLWCSLGNEGMGELAERSNQALGIHREVQDEIALRSQKLAAAATDRGRLALEIVPINSSQAHLAEDEGIRPGVSLEKLERLAPAFASHGTITAGNASQMSDGSSVGALTSFAYSEKVGRAPLARIIALAEVAGPDSSLHLKPAAAIEAALERAGLSLANVDLFEINEAFAGVVEASRRELSIPLDVVNVNGGAIALGHPLGGSGFRLLLTLAHELEQRQSQFGVAALCGGGGQGIAIVIERMGS